MKINNTKKLLLLLLIIIGRSTIASAQKIAAGGWHSVIVCADSTVKTFGENATGQLGNGANTDSNTPVSATGLTGIISVSAGGDQLEAHSLALKNDGTVWAWGSNLYGALGNGNTTVSTTPVKALVLTTITVIAAGGWHSVALKSDGTIWTWGWNTDGQLGDGTVVDKSTPAQISGLSNVKEIASGSYHVLALKNDGTVWTWGDNLYGQVGDGTNTDRKIPAQVSGLTDVVQIKAGRFFSLAVKSDGTVWTWGENNYGQLGDGTTTDRKTPVQVSGLTVLVPAIMATGAFHCLAVKTDNTVYTWGRNTYGNLGDGTTTNSSVPVLMTGANSIAGMAAGTNFSLLYKTDGTFWGCGRNLSGQLGDGTFLQRNTITQSTTLCTIGTVGIKTLNQANSIETSVFPNPSINGKFTLQIANKNLAITKGNIVVNNTIGEKVFELNVNSYTTNNEITIDLSEQKSGIYFMTVIAGEYKFCKKLIKQ